MFDALAWEQALWSALLALALTGLIGTYLLDNPNIPLKSQGIILGSIALLFASQVGYLRAATIAMTDASPGGLPDAMWLVFTQTHFGAMLQLSGLASLMLLALQFVPGLSSANLVWRASYGVSLLVLAVARAGAGHAIDHGMFSVAVFNDTVHILAACAWCGVAGVCSITTFRWQTWSHNEQLILTRRVSAIATIALLAVAISGIFNVFRMIDADDLSWQTLNTPYVRMLAYKLGGVAIAVMFGAYNRWMTLPRMQLHPGGAGRRFAQVLFIETVVLGMVLIAATSLGTMMPPM